MKWFRVTVADKIAFREDLATDPTLTDKQKAMVSVIATHWDNATLRAECSLTFIAAGAGTTKKVVSKYVPALLASGRISKVADPTYTTSTFWTVNWWFRGSAWVRHNNGGKPVLDCRKESPHSAQRESPTATHRESPNDAQGGVPQRCQSPSTASPPAGGLIPILTDRDIGAPSGARPDGGAQGAPVKKEKKDNPSKAQPGYAKWKIVHAEFTGNDDETFVAHLRSGKSRKFVLRCHVDSDEYGSLDDTLFGIDGDADAAIGEMVQMSTNRSGAKTFLRAAPTPWSAITILSGETNEDGTARLRAVFHDDGDYEGNLPLSQAAAAGLADTCGGEDEAIGARVRYRLMPDDTLEFQRVATA
jgi:hypothetical protein